jgi:hypothetical protein
MDSTGRLPGRWPGCILLAVLLGWGMGNTRLLADGPYPHSPPGATELPPGVPPADNSPSHKPIRDWLFRGRPLGCWASFNGYSCSSFHSEHAFIFGSCRTFFGEPCLKSAPPSPMPPWAGGAAGPPWGGEPPLPGEPGVPVQPASCSCR